MIEITLKIDDRIADNFLWLLSTHFDGEIKILEYSDHVTEDNYLRSIPGMVESLKKAREEPVKNGICMQTLGW